MTVFDEVAPVLAFLLCIPLVIWWLRVEWKKSERDRMIRKRVVKLTDALRRERDDTVSPQWLRQHAHGSRVDFDGVSWRWPVVRK